jgi:uncharacterized protein
MSDAPAPKIGSVGWLDLTVPDAAPVRDFYSAVVGWESQAFDMDGYQDFVMSIPGEGAVAGVCHARGPNKDLPPVWMVYFVVADLDASVAKVVTQGGSIVAPPRKAGGGRYAVVQDPAGAHCALYEGAAP